MSPSGVHVLAGGMPVDELAVAELVIDHDQIRYLKLSGGTLRLPSGGGEAGFHTKRWKERGTATNTCDYRDSY